MVVEAYLNHPTFFLQAWFYYVGLVGACDPIIFNMVFEAKFSILKSS